MSSNGHVLLAAPKLHSECPPIASARGTLRAGLPALYQDPPDGLAMRFVEAFERVLDPRVAVVDCRTSYICPDLAPDDIVHALLRWVGFEPDELPPGTARGVLAHADELTRMRGTRRGLELSLRCLLPSLQIVVQDSGGTFVVPPDAAVEPLLARRPRVVLRCRVTLAPGQLDTIARALRHHLSAHVGATVIHGGGHVDMGATP